MKKKHLKAQNKFLRKGLQILEKKCACLELILSWQSSRLEIKREMRLKKERYKGESPFNEN